MSPGRVVIVLKGYPRLSEAFIAHEIRGLEARGVEPVIVSLRHPTDRARHRVHAEIQAPVTYLPEYVWQEPVRVLGAWWRMRRTPRYRAARGMWLRDLVRDITPNRVRRFAQALVLADGLPPEASWLHAHFLHTPASVARYAAALTGLPWSASAHAKDIWTTPSWEKRDKLADCQWLVTCTAAGRDHLAGLARDPGKVELVYHGLDPERFPATHQARPMRDGSDAAAPVTILAVGRLVEKKAFDVLIDALAELPAGLNWRLVHVGGGALGDRLRARAAARGVADRIDWQGAQPHDRLIEHYRAADMFVLPLRIARDGDRDGMPNVLMEAQSQGMACIAGAISGVPELIEDGETGVLVPPEDPASLTHAILALATDPERRAMLGSRAQRRVAERFSFDAGVDRLAGKFGAGRPPLGADWLPSAPPTDPEKQPEPVGGRGGAG